MVIKTEHAATSETQIPTEAENLIEAVQLLHSLAYDAPTIARRLPLDQAAVEHVIKHGWLPQRQLNLAWGEVSR